MYAHPMNLHDQFPWTWRQIILAAVALALTYILLQLTPILTPFLLGAGFAYILNPVVEYLVKWRLPRWLAVSLVFLLLVIFWTLLAILVIPLLLQQAETFWQTAPESIAKVDQTLRPILNNWFGIEGTLNVQTIRDFITNNMDTISLYLGNILRSGLGVVGLAMNLLILPVVMFYLLLDWNKILSKFQQILPRDIEPTVTKLALQSDEALGGFLRGQILVMLFLAVFYSVGLWIAGIPFALFIGVTAGLISFVPYLGNFVGIGLATIMVLFYQNSYIPLVWVAAVFGIGQLIEGMILTPILVGDRIRLHPLVVIFAVLAGGQLLGFTGVLIALPLAAVLAVVARHFYSRYRDSELYTAEAD